MSDATVDARNLIDPTMNRVTVLGPSAHEGYTRVRFEDGTENTFPANAVTPDRLIDEVAALSDAELRERLDTALLNLDAPVDAPDNDGVDVEVRVLMTEAHHRALAEDEVRGVVAVLGTREVQGLLLVASREKQPLLLEELARRAVHHAS